MAPRQRHGIALNKFSETRPIDFPSACCPTDFGLLSADTWTLITMFPIQSGGVEKKAIGPVCSRSPKYNERLHSRCPASDTARAHVCRKTHCRFERPTLALACATVIAAARGGPPSLQEHRTDFHPLSIPNMFHSLNNVTYVYTSTLVDTSSDIAPQHVCIMGSE